LALNRDKVWASAQKLLQSGKYDKATLELKKLVEEDPKDVRTLLKLGDTYVKVGARADAISAYQSVANIYAEQGFFLKAVAVYKQMLRVDASVASIHLKLADMYQQLGLANDSMQHYQQVAVLYEQQGKTAESLDVLKRMVDLDPENLPSRIKLAELFAKEGRQQEAIGEFRSAADFLKSAERFDDYVRVAERLVYFEPSALDVTLDLAKVYLARGEAKAALGKLQLCFKTDPRNLDVLALIAEAFLAMQQVAKTISVYKEMARILESSQRHDEAQRYWRRVLELVPDDGESQQALGLIGQPTAAPVVVAPAPQANPEEEQLARLLTETDVYMKYGLRDKALEHIQRVFAIRPNHVEAQSKLKDIHQAMGNRAGLVDALRRLVSLATSTGDARLETWTRELAALEGAPRPTTTPAAAPLRPAPPSDDDMVLLDDGVALDESAVVDEGGLEESTMGVGRALRGDVGATLPPDENLSGSGEPLQVDEPAYASPDDEFLLVSGPSDAYVVEEPAPAVPAAVGLPAIEDGAYEAFGADTGAFEQATRGSAGMDAFDEVGDFLGDAIANEQAVDDGLEAADDALLDEGAADTLLGAGLDDAAKEAMRLLDEGFDTSGVPSAAATFDDGGGAVDEDPFASSGELPPEFGDAPRHDSFASTEIMSLSPEELAGLRAMARGPNPPSLVQSDEAPATEFVPVKGVASASLLQSKPDPAFDATGFDDGSSFAEPDASPVEAPGDLDALDEFGDSTVAMALPDNLDDFRVHTARAASSLSEEAKGFDDDFASELPAGELDAFESEHTLDGGGTPALDGGLDFDEGALAAADLGDVDLAGAGLDAGDAFLDATGAQPMALASDEFSYVDDEPASNGAGEAPVADKAYTPKLGVSEAAHGFEDDPAADFFPEELEEAEFFIKQDLLDEAKEILIEIQDNVPDSPRVAHMLARIEAKENGEPEPPAPWEQKIIAEVAEEIGDLAGALADALPPEEMQVSVEEVLEQFKRGVKEAVGDDDAETHYNLGIAYREMGLVDDAISEFEIAARAPSKAPDAFHLIGLTHVDNGRPEHALRAFDQALSALGDGGNGVAKKQRGVNEYQRGVCFEALTKHGEALQAYRRARELGADMRDLGDRIAKVTERLVGTDAPVAVAGSVEDGTARKKNIDYL